MNVQAGARRFQRARESSSSMRAKSNVLAIFDDRNDSVEPVRSITAIGNVLTMSCQRCHRWKVFRLSAPMIQMKWTCGLRALTRAKVFAVKLVAKSRSNVVIWIEGCRPSLSAQNDAFGEAAADAAGPSVDCRE